MMCKHDMKEVDVLQMNNESGKYTVVIFKCKKCGFESQEVR